MSESNAETQGSAENVEGDQVVVNESEGGETEAPESPSEGIEEQTGDAESTESTGDADSE